MSAIELEFKDQPSMPRLLLRAGMDRKSAQAGPYPEIAAHLQRVNIDRKRLRRYCEVCGFDPDGDTIPATYPHLAAFALHMEMLLQPGFPFTPMGVVHTANTITQYRPIGRDEPLALACRIDAYREVDSGLEVDIASEARVGGERVWSDLTTVLKRGGNGATGKRQRPALPEFEHSETWSLPANLGRRYAGVSGDYNPIHLYPATAKLLGFKRQIAHGMWSKARCLAALQSKLGSGTFSVDVAFKTPLYLPAEVALHYSESPGSIAFSLRNGVGNRPHLNGELKAL